MRFKWRNALIVLVLYVYLAASLFEAGDVGAVFVASLYVAAAMLVCRAMIASAERRRGANSLEFSRTGAANALGERADRARHRARRDEHAPAHRAVCPRQLLDHVEVRERLDLPAPQRPRQEHPVQPSVRERLDERLRQRPPALDLVGRGANAGRQLARRR